MLRRPDLHEAAVPVVGVVRGVGRVEERESVILGRPHLSKTANEVPVGSEGAAVLILERPGYDVGLAESSVGELTMMDSC